VTLGSRSVMAALAAGLLFTLMPAVFTTYLPSSISEVPTILFGLGAIALANHPEGAIAQNAEAIRGALARYRARRADPDQPAADVPELALATGTVPSKESA
jgi:branched-chain amino acid transport system permease protein